MTPLLEVSHVCYAYHTLSGETTALTDITFSVDEGEFLVIVGPSGCGKSTLLSLLSGLIPAEQGIIRLNQSPLNRHRSVPLAICCKKTICLNGAPSIKMSS